MRSQPASGYWVDLGRISYEEAFDIQEQALAARIKGRLPSTVILQESPPVFTIGRTGSRCNILASAAELERRGIQVLEVNRGGDVTYHGPGQLVASPLLFLGDLGLNANQYLHRLEDVLIALLASFGVHAHKKDGYPGVWWKQSKLAAVGIAVKHGYTFHGLALNVNVDLSPFDLINPCGVKQMPVASLCHVLGRPVSMPEIKQRLRDALEKSFSLNFELLSRPRLLTLMSAHPEMKSGHLQVSNSEMRHFLQDQDNQGVGRRRTSSTSHN